MRRGIGVTSNTAAQCQRHVVEAAFAWWRDLRPQGWTHADHIAAPQVNCETEAERTLALAIARLSAARRGEATRSAL